MHLCVCFSFEHCLCLFEVATARWRRKRSLKWSYDAWMAWRKQRHAWYHHTSYSTGHNALLVVVFISKSDRGCASANPKYEATPARYWSQDISVNLCPNLWSWSGNSPKASCVAVFSAFFFWIFLKSFFHAGARSQRISGNYECAMRKITNFDRRLQVNRYFSVTTVNAIARYYEIVTSLWGETVEHCKFYTRDLHLLKKGRFTDLLSL